MSAPKKPLAEQSRDSVAAIHVLIANMLRDLHNYGSAALDSVRSGLEDIEVQANHIHLAAAEALPVGVAAPKGEIRSMFPPYGPINPDGTPVSSAPSRTLFPAQPAPVTPFFSAPPPQPVAPPA